MAETVLTPVGTEPNIELPPTDTTPNIPTINRPKDVCDRHPVASAWVVAMFEAGPLFLCAFCFTQNETLIRSLTDQIRDERHMLAAEEGRGSKRLPDQSHTGDTRNV